MAARDDLASRIADGLSGYFQYVNATQLLSMPGEDTAQFVMCQILQSQRRYRIEVSAKPPNWTGANRVDAALLGKVGTAGWYGVVEVKWITSVLQRDTARLKIIQDCARVASVKTGNLDAKFFVVGFTENMLTEVFDRPHEAGTDPEHQRVLLGTLLRRTTPSRAASVSHAMLTEPRSFPTYQDRVPAGATFETGLQARLLATSSIKSGSGAAGQVLVWQVNKRSGRAVT